MSQNIFISYANEYDLYDGEVDIGDLPVEQQNELIKLTFSTEGDSRAFVMKNNINKSQAEGLWSLVVLLGTALERKGAIKDFDNRSSDDIQIIIEQLAEFALWQRLEEAYPPFDFLEKKTDYHWSELEKIQKFFEQHAGDPLHTIRMALFSILSNRDIDDKYDTRMSYDCCKAWLEGKKITLHQDRMLANVAGAKGIVKTDSPLFFYVGLALLLVTSITWFLVIHVVALVALVCAILAFITARSSLEDALMERV